MEKRELCIIPPEGWEINKEESTFEKVVFKKVKELPKTWEDLKTVTGFYMDSNQGITQGVNNIYTTLAAREIFPTREEAEASIALAQLCQLRNKYNDGWKPDWTVAAEDKFVICAVHNKITIELFWAFSCTLAFKTESLRDEFLKNFKDLIEIAKPFL